MTHGERKNIGRVIIENPTYDLELLYNIKISLMGLEPLTIKCPFYYQLFKLFIRNVKIGIKFN